MQLLYDPLSKIMAFAAPSPLDMLPHGAGFARRHVGAIMMHLQTQQQ